MKNKQKSMPLLPEYSKNNIAIWKIEESSEELLSYLSQREVYLPYLGMIRSERRKQEWLASRVLLKTILGNETLISYRSNGAPYLADIPLYISISHTQNYAVVLLQDDSFAGIDIECRSNRVLKIRSRFMSVEEEAGVDPAHEVDYLLIHWCAKETLFKMISQEEVDFLQHLHVKPFLFSESGTIEVWESRTENQYSFILHYVVTSDFVMTWS